MSVVVKKKKKKETNPVQNPNTASIFLVRHERLFLLTSQSFITKTYSKEFKELIRHTMWIIWGLKTHGSGQQRLQLTTDNHKETVFLQFSDSIGYK